MLITLGAGREIVFNTGASATKFFTLATKSWKLVAKLATRMFHHNFTLKMATNVFWIGYHFEEFRSQVAIRKKKLISCSGLGVKGPVKLIDQTKSVYFFVTEE